MTKILAIAPYEGLKTLIQDCCKERADLQANIFVGDRDDGLAIAQQQMELYHYDIILSRGFTASQIAGRYKTPVVEIEVSGFDVLRMIRLAQNFAGKYAIVGFHSLTASAELACRILDQQADIFTASDVSEVENYIRRLKEEGYSLIIGDVITTDLAKRMGLRATLVTSGKESVEKALSECVKTNELMTGINREMRLFARVLKEKKITAFLLDKEFALVCRLSDSPLADDCQPAVKRLLQRRQNLGEESGFHISIDGSPQKITVVPYEDSGKEYYLCLSEPVYTPARKDKTVAFRFLDVGGKHAVSLNAICSNSDFMNGVIAKARTFADVSLPVVIDGERGVGKESFALAIHNEGKHRPGSFLKVDCTLMTDEMWDFLFTHEKSPFCENGYTVYFHLLDSLTTERQQKLCDYLETTAMEKRHRIISSSLSPPALHVQEGSMLPALIKKLRTLSIHIPSLGERRDEIQGLAGIYIGTFNEQYAKSVVGLEEEALQLLKEHRWQENIEEFTRTIRELVLLAHGEYITAQETRSVLGRPAVSAKTQGNIDLSLSLEEMEAQIIRMVLEEENMNQSRAAKRLGISRSTMWRKVKE